LERRGIPKERGSAQLFKEEAKDIGQKEGSKLELEKNR